MHTLCKENLILLLFSLISFLLDKLTKFLIKAFLKVEYTVYTFIPNFLSFVYIKNKGGIFGIWQDKGWFFVISGIAIIILICIIYFKKRSVIQKAGAGLIIGGACGNIHDRLSEGNVIDFINFTFHTFNYPTFNLADVFISVGCIILILK